MPITLSIITATYNRGHVIKDCLDSVLRQNFKNIEHIIIDNLSSDNTQEIVEEYIKKADYKVRYIREADTGIYNAFNKGIRIAEGDWIHFLNSDDRYYDTELLNEIYSQDNDSYDIIACTIISDNKNNQRYWEPRYDNVNHEHIFPHPGTLIKRKFLIDNGFYRETLKITSDAVFNWEHYGKSKFKLFKSILTIMSSDGISNNPTLSYLFEIIYGICVYRNISFYRKILKIIEGILYFIYCILTNFQKKNFLLKFIFTPIIKIINISINIKNDKKG
jgi:glycosyltransferase involved in cell wall biosynthesis